MVLNRHGTNTNLHIHDANSQSIIAYNVGHNQNRVSNNILNEKKKVQYLYVL